MSSDNQDHAVILVIDDNPNNLNLLMDYLERSGFKTLLASEGKDGIAIAELAMPDIILLDIRMPGIDGIETCKLLKQNPSTKDIPVIFMTAISELNEKIRGFEAGAADYITKAFHNEEVLARITKELTIQRQKKELEKYNEILKELNKNLHELNATKDKLYSIIAHDLRGPVSSMIIGTRSLLECFDNYDKEKLRTFIREINANSIQIYSLLENLLNWAKAQTDSIRYEPIKVSVNYMVDSNVKLFRHAANEKNINIVNMINSNSVIVYADVNMTITVIRNLLSNAIKFTPKDGEIRISAKDCGNMLEIAIADSGKGIPMEHISKLFEISDKFITTGTRGERGTGLGLLVCKEFIEKNNGRIWVHSEIGKGSTFKFTLPKPSENIEC